MLPRAFQVLMLMPTAMVGHLNVATRCSAHDASTCRLGLYPRPSDQPVHLTTCSELQICVTGAVDFIAASDVSLLTDARSTLRLTHPDVSLTPTILSASSDEERLYKSRE